MGRPMSLDVGGIDGRGLRHRARHCQRLDQVHPEPAPRPAVEAVVDRRRRTVLDRAVTPAATSFENMDDARDHPAIVDATGSRLVLGNKPFDCGPLLVREPKQLRHQHSSGVSSPRNHDLPTYVNADWVWSPRLSASRSNCATAIESN